MLQILNTNDSHINVKLDEWVRDLCIANDYKIKRHFTAAGTVSFTINKKPFASLFFDRMDEFTQHTMINRDKIRKMASYGPLVNNAGLTHLFPDEKAKVKLYDLTMSNFLHAEPSPEYDDKPDSNLGVISCIPYNTAYQIPENVANGVYLRLASDILYEAEKLNISREIIVYNIIEKLIEKSKP